MLTVYATYGWVRGSLGWPAGNQTCTSGTCSQLFQNGTLFKPASGPSYVVATGVIGEAYLAEGGPTGSLGYPINALNTFTGANGSGIGQSFQNGQILSSPTGTFIVRTAMLTVYATYGWVRGSLGWPAGNQTCTSGTCSQLFQNGTLVVTADGS
jgi:uncharacterized protein with LGFP repeats